MRQNEQKPQRILLSIATRSPSLMYLTCEPTSTTSPQNSWPSTVFGLKWCLPSRILTSEPQMPTVLTLSTTSSGSLTCGTGICSITSLPTSLNTNAFILSMVISFNDSILNCQPTIGNARGTSDDSRTINLPLMTTSEMAPSEVALSETDVSGAACRISVKAMCMACCPISNCGWAMVVSAGDT